MGGRGTWSSSWDNKEGFAASLGSGPASQKIHASEFQVIDGNRTSTMRTLEAVEEKIRGRSVEHGVVVDDQGFVVIAYRGNTHSVNFGPESDKVRGNIVTHNHPNGSFFSKGDLDAMNHLGARGVRATTGRATYSLIAMNHRSDPAGLAAAYRRNKPRLMSYSKGRISTPAYYRAHESWMRTNAPKYGYSFTITMH